MQHRTDRSSAPPAHQPFAARSSAPTQSQPFAAKALSAERISAIATPDSSPTPHQTVCADRNTRPDTSDSHSAAIPPHGFAERTSTSDTPDSSDTPPPSGAQWLGTTHAKRLLGVGSENTIKNWVRYGYLRARRLPNGRIQVLRSDVVRLSYQPPSAWSPTAPSPTGSEAPS